MYSSKPFNLDECHGVGFLFRALYTTHVGTRDYISIHTHILHFLLFFFFFNIIFGVIRVFKRVKYAISFLSFSYVFSTIKYTRFTKTIFFFLYNPSFRYVTIRKLNNDT